MKIALVTRRYPPFIGGAERVLSYLAPALAAEGVEVVVLTSRPPASAPLAVPASVIPVVRFPSPPVRAVGTWIYMRSLRRWFARNRVDLAYVSMLKHDAYVALGEGRRIGFPVVLRPEGAGATGDLAWQSWGRFGRRIGERCKQADAVVAISSAIDDELLSSGYERSKIVRLPNGVPIPDRAWKPRENWHSQPRAAFIGRLAPEKALETLISAWPRVRAAFPSARLSLIGEGPERAGLEDVVRRLGLSEAVELPGSSSDPTSILRESDLFLLPSREEGMSIALLEAMALGIPVIASSISGNLKLVTDLTHGRLFPAGDSDALARTIVNQWNDFGRAAEMATRARERVIAQYSITAVAKQHIALFDRLIRERRA